MKTLYLVREDLRLYDNPALTAAAQAGELALLYVVPQGLGGASRWWLHHSLAALQQRFEQLGCQLVLRQGDPLTEVLDVVAELGVDQLVWNRVYSPSGIELGRQLKQSLDALQIKVQSFNGQLLIEPSQVLTLQHTPYKVFTPFWRTCLQQLSPDRPLPEPAIKPLKHALRSVPLDSLNLLPHKPDWSVGLAERWQAGEQGAQIRWQAFLESGVHSYKEGRDIPSAASTSFLSPHLAFGEISVRQLWHEMRNAIAQGDVSEGNGQKFLAEIGWREFSRYLIVHFPHFLEQGFNQKFLEFPWQERPELLSAWQQGKTGYPIVDAGMRELWHTGYMHNRVRMIVASFLTKHCLIHWQHGADWFWDTLVDADIANNTASWQWVSGCGADAAPYFRIFNPTLQSEKFDKQGVYLRQWLPELSELPNKFIHKPWDASELVLSEAGVKLGDTYPKPIIDHAQARQAALDAYQAFKLN